MAEADFFESLMKHISLPNFEAYYHGGSSRYYYRNTFGQFMAAKENEFIRVVRKVGVLGATQNATRGLDDYLTSIQVDHSIDYAGRVAGYQAGLRKMCGNRVLVTSSASLIERHTGDWPNTQRWLKATLGSRGEEQTTIMFAWLAVALKAVTQSRNLPGQVMILCGPQKSSKTALIQMIGRVLGGRVAKPYRAMSGRTQFNSDLVGAETLIIDNELVPGGSSNRFLKTKIQEFVGASIVSCHSKGFDAIPLTPIQRLIIALDDSPDYLNALPNLTSEVRDKLMILRTNSVPSIEAQWTSIQSAMESELPAFVDFLTTFEIPSHLAENRFGVRAYHDPELAAELGDYTGDEFMALIDAALSGSEWEGSAPQLLQRLLDSPVGKAAAAILRVDAGSLGTRLGLLSRKYPDRVKYKRTSNKRIWVLYPPKLEVKP